MAEMNVSHIDLTDPDASLGLLGFTDWRVFAVSNDYEGQYSGRVCGPNAFDVHQSDDGPAFIVVGSSVTSERLQRHQAKLREQYGVTLDQLCAAREGAVVVVRTSIPSGWPNADDVAKPSWLAMQAMHGVSSAGAAA